MKHFLYAIRHILSVTFGILMLTALIFYLFKLDFHIYQLLLCLVILGVGSYLALTFIQYQREQDQLSALKECQTDYQKYREEQENKQRANEAYFLLWVHQIKTPITASQLLLKECDNEVGDALKQEMMEIERYTAMALSYLKLQNPKTDLVASTISIDALVSPLLKKYRMYFIREKTILHYQPISTEIVTDKNWSRLMIEQILNNALKFARGKEIWIEYDTEKNQLIIKDNGSGIRTEDLPKIFDKGYSGTNYSHYQRSSGIGLFLVKDIAERLNQPVTVTSEFGEGTTFTIQCHINPLMSLP